jgi:hypothetical protein
MHNKFVPGSVQWLLYLQNEGLAPMAIEKKKFWGPFWSYQLTALLLILLIFFNYAFFKH